MNKPKTKIHQKQKLLVDLEQEQKLLVDLEQEQKLLDSMAKSRKKARARHWKRTGVSDVTIKWMEENSLL